MPDLKDWGRHELAKMKQDMDNMFDALCLDLNLPTPHRRVAGDLEFFDNGENLIARLVVPGMKPDDLNVRVEDQMLTISGRSEVSLPGQRDVLEFHREIKLPCKVKPEDTEAVFEDDVLEVRLPRCRNQVCQVVRVVKKES